MLRPASLTMPIVGFANKLMGLYERDELVLMKTTLEESARCSSWPASLVSSPGCSKPTA